MGDEDTRADADKVEDALRLSPRASVLDVPCGDGRIAVELAARGHQVTGVDLNEVFLAAAARRSEDRRVSMRWERHDMRELPFDPAFDAAFNFNGSFGYFDDVGDARTAESVHRSLVPGGRFLIDIPTVETVFPDFRERTWFAADQIQVLRENRFVPETGRTETHWTLVAPDGRCEDRQSSMRLYTYRELAEPLSRVGFTRVEGSDAHDLAPFELGASRLMIVATK